VIVHPQQNLRQRFRAGARLRVSECQGGPSLVEKPAGAALFRVRWVMIEVDRAAEINPACQGELVLVAQSRHLDGLAVRALVSAGYCFRRRHGAAEEVHIPPLVIAMVAPVEQVLLVIVVQWWAGDVLVVEAVEALAEHLPDQRTAPRLERP